LKAVARRYIAEHSVFISDKAVDTIRLFSTLQAVEILCKKFIFRLLIASAAGGKPKYN